MWLVATERMAQEKCSLHLSSKRMKAALSRAVSGKARRAQWVGLQVNVAAVQPWTACSMRKIDPDSVKPVLLGFC